MMPTHSVKLKRNFPIDSLALKFEELDDDTLTIIPCSEYFTPNRRRVGYKAKTRHTLQNA